MQNRRELAVGVAFAGLSCAVPGAAARAPVVNADGLYFNPRYDHRADPAADLASARALAGNRNILLEVGGDWCVWCRILDAYLAEEADVRAAFRASFLIVKVNWSRTQQNEAFLAAYPPISGYPSFVILDNRGRYLGSEETAPLESGRSYDRARMLAFAARWRPA